MAPIDSSGELNAAVRATLARIPEWVRSDLAAKDSKARERAEETLAAMIVAAVGDEA